jgi:hypothetical protein
MRLVRWMVLVAACGSAQTTQQTRPIVSSAPRSAALHASSGDSELVGRLVLDGHPVPYFGITFARSFAFTRGYPPPIEIRNVDGSFAVRAPSGTWDVIIGGPGFARRVVAGIELSRHHITNLGEISVRRGFSIHGVLHDEAGKAVAHARVTFSATEYDDSKGLAAYAVGNIETTSDAHGAYRIDGAAALLLSTGARPRLRAVTTDGRASLPVLAPNDDATIDLTVTPTGSIDVQVTSGRPAYVGVRPIGIPADALNATRHGSRYFIDDVPVGNYEVRAGTWGAGTSTAQVSVAAGTVTSVTLAMPSLPDVAVSITSTTGPCGTMDLFVDDGAMVATTVCDGNSATFAVPPGLYLACADGAWRSASCGGIHVYAGLGPQVFTIPR